MWDTCISIICTSSGTLRGNSEADFGDEETQVRASVTLKSMLWFVLFYHTHCRRLEVHKYSFNFQAWEEDTVYQLLGWPWSGSQVWVVCDHLPSPCVFSRAWLGNLGHTVSDNSFFFFFNSITKSNVFSSHWHTYWFFQCPKRCTWPWGVRRWRKQVPVFEDTKLHEETGM